MKKIYFLSIALLIAGISSVSAKSTPSKRLQSSLEKPIVLPATNVTEHGFTANWQEVKGTEAYCVFVYTEHQATKAEKFYLIKEDFDLIDFGTIENPVWGEELYETLDPYTLLPNWSVYGYTSYAQGMIGGVIYSPYFDARNNGGKYDVTVTVYGQSGDEIFVHTEGSKEEVQSFILKQAGFTTATLSFSNGVQDTYFHINNTKSNDFYIDEASVSQDLKAGEKAYVLVDLNEAVMGENTSCNFKNLRYAPKATKVFYDLYAVVREYNDPQHPDRYTQVYSPFSDKMEVNLGNEGGINEIQATNDKAYSSSNGIELTLTQNRNVQVYNILGQQLINQHFVAGSHKISIEKGIYIVYIDGMTQKLIIK